MKDTAFYKMKPGSKEVDSPTAFNSKDQGTMSAFNYGSPMNNKGDKKSGGDDFNYTSDMGKYNPTITAYKGDAFVGTRGNQPQKTGSEVRGFTEMGGGEPEYFSGVVTGPATGSKSKQSRRVKGATYKS